MMRPKRYRIALAAALLLPLAILGISWATTWRAAQQGQDWLIPIQGYDPRDLLRGHYVQYRYAWPVLPAPPRRGNDPAARFDPEYADALCIIGTAPDISLVREIGYGEDRTDRLPDGCTIVARATLGTRSEVRGLVSGILYASQARAITLSRQLADPNLQGLIRVRIRPDGVMRPIDMEFRPRPAR